MREILIDIQFFQLALIWMAVLCASVLRSFTGFGFALAAVPVFSLFLQPTEAVVLSAGLALVLGLLSLPSYRGVITVAELAPLLLMALPGTVIGAIALTRMSASFFQLAVGLSVLFAVLGISFSRNVSTVRRPLLGWLVGFMSGLMNGAMAIPGPPVIVYALYSEPEPRRSRALMMSFFSVSALLALCSYGVGGYINLHITTYFLLALPVLYGGDKLGTALFLRFGDAFYRRVALIALAGLGIVITLRGLL